MTTRRHALATLAAPALLAAQAPSDQVRAAIIGVGGRGSSDLTSLVGSPNVKLVAVCDIDPAARDRGATIGKDHKPELLDDWRKLIERKDLDAVVIATPVDLHAEMTVAALDAGLSVYLEKPMGVDEQAVHIIDLMNWAMKTHPVRAMGSGGINVYENTPPGRTIYDNYAVIFEYPRGERLTFTHIYIDPPGFSGIQERIWGSEGAVDLPSGTFYARTDRGEERVPPRKLFEGDRGNMNQHAMDAFIGHVRDNSEPLNNATYGKYATLAAIMGRKAIDEKRFVTWDEVDS